MLVYLTSQAAGFREYKKQFPDQQDHRANMAHATILAFRKEAENCGWFEDFPHLLSIQKQVEDRVIAMFTEDAPVLDTAAFPLFKHDKNAFKRGSHLCLAFTTQYLDNDDLRRIGFGMAYATAGKWDGRDDNFRWLKVTEQHRIHKKRRGDAVG